MAGPSIAVLFLLLLLVPAIAGLVLIVFTWRRGCGYPACGKCGYDVTGTLGTPNTRCPECGGEFAVVGITPPRPRTNVRLLWLGIVLIIAPIVLVTTASLVARASQARASRAATRAIAVQSQIMQQVQLASALADPALVEMYHAKIAGMTVAEASARLSAVTQEMGERQVDQTLTEEIAANLRAEFKALSEHINDKQQP